MYPAANILAPFINKDFSHGANLLKNNSWQDELGWAVLFLYRKNQSYDL